jgi:hypothetical protein
MKLTKINARRIEQIFFILLFSLSFIYFSTQLIYEVTTPKDLDSNPQTTTQAIGNGTSH